MYDLVYKVAKAEGAVAKLTEQLALSEAQVVKLEGIVEEQRRILLSRRIVYSIYYNSTLVLPSNWRGEKGC